ncbi:hypothetical protein GOV09_02485 [Candidatus Woesearchaeota archaeon]|nr:hypothetical protein [Candidatus Woesearchaeota archaeon]
MKKGMELTMNTVIVAAILLVVLFVIIAIFTGRMGGISDAFKELTRGAGDGNNEALEGLGLRKCTSGQTECRGKDLYECKGEEWSLRTKDASTCQ